MSVPVALSDYISNFYEQYRVRFLGEMPPRICPGIPSGIIAGISSAISAEFIQKKITKILSMDFSESIAPRIIAGIPDAISFLLLRFLQKLCHKYF